jgi:hypothetical protein
MMTHHQAASITAEQAAPYDVPTVDDDTDDPVTRIHRYQQQLRQELLGAVASRATRPSRLQRLWDLPRTSLFAGATVQAIKGRVEALADHGVTRRSLTAGATGAA